MSTKTVSGPGEIVDPCVTEEDIETTILCWVELQNSGEFKKAEKALVKALGQQRRLVAQEARK